MLDLILINLTSPAILFFILGCIAGFVKSDLEVPKSISSYLSIYLMMAIGFKGGVALSETQDINSTVILTFVAGVVTGFVQPVIGFILLRLTTKLDNITAAAVAAHYGSISMVTFVTAASFLDSSGISYAGYMVAVLALMEAPAILTGLFLAKKRSKKEHIKEHTNSKELTREILTNGAILLLTGAFIVGLISGSSGMEKMHGFLVLPFQGILALFLLDMGLLVSKRAHDLKEFTLSLFAFGIYMPLIGAAVGFGISALLGLSEGTALLFIVLVASASYIAVPAAMRLALPEAKASIYLPLSLAITFPFNIIIGIPLYAWLVNNFLPS
jgi:hypothetical protein